ncbi:MAG: hypothetical protein FWG98_14275 [Candidatus Cloacimonetes bacterium]|nr:hypothetical protein [Candidatus Cloacimonadota bacterium]
MPELKISPNFTIEDIHKIREYNYEITKNMSKEERRSYYKAGAERAFKEMEELKKEKKN